MAYRLYASSVCDMNSAAAAAICGLWSYTSVICLYLTKSLKVQSRYWGGVVKKVKSGAV